MSSLSVFQLLAIYLGIAVVYGILRWVGFRLRYGVIGLILILQPVAMSLYTELDPRITLASVLLGLFVLLIDARRPPPP